MPQMMLEKEPEPALFSTRTGQIRAPGATPTTPMVLSSAPMVPATWVPCPLPSSALVPVEQFFAAAVWTLRSGWSRSTPVSMTATSTFTRVSILLIAAVWLSSASTRLIPVGSVCASMLTGRSGLTETTRGSTARRLAAAAVMVAE